MHSRDEKWVFWLLLGIVFMAAIGWNWWMIFALFCIVPWLGGHHLWGAETEDVMYDDEKPKRKNDEKSKNDFV